MDLLDIEINSTINEELGESVVEFDPSFDIPVYEPDDEQKYKILVLSGGGIKGIAHIGALKALQDLGYLHKFNTFAGTSVGAMILGLFVAGLTPDELLLFIKKFNLENMKNINMLNIIQNKGLDDGSKVNYVIKRLIQSKGHDQEITLEQLYQKTKKKLIITTTCLNTMEACYLSYETHPHLPLYLAIRMSISIPIYYTPVVYNDFLYIDGGCIDNYPIHNFKDRLNEVLGIYLIEATDVIHNIDDVETYVLKVFQCFMEGVNFNSIKGYEKYTVNVNMEAINIIKYQLTNSEKDEMFEKGYQSVIAYFVN